MIYARYRARRLLSVPLLSHRETPAAAQQKRLVPHPFSVVLLFSAYKQLSFLLAPCVQFGHARACIYWGTAGGSWGPLAAAASGSGDPRGLLRPAPEIRAAGCGVDQPPAWAMRGIEPPHGRLCGPVSGLLQHGQGNPCPGPGMRSGRLLAAPGAPWRLLRPAAAASGSGDPRGRLFVVLEHLSVQRNGRRRVYCVYFLKRQPKGFVITPRFALQTFHGGF